MPKPKISKPALDILDQRNNDLVQMWEALRVPLWTEEEYRNMPVLSRNQNDFSSLTSPQVLYLWRWQYISMLDQRLDNDVAKYMYDRFTDSIEDLVFEPVTR